MGELPEQIRQRFRDLKLPPADVLVLADDLQTAQFFDSTLAAGAPAKAAANWIMGDITAFCKVPTQSRTSSLQWTVHHHVINLLAIINGPAMDKSAHAF